MSSQSTYNVHLNTIRSYNCRSKYFPDESNVLVVYRRLKNDRSGTCYEHLNSSLEGKSLSGEWFYFDIINYLITILLSGHNFPASSPWHESMEEEMSVVYRGDSRLLKAVAKFD